MEATVNAELSQLLIDTFAKMSSETILFFMGSSEVYHIAKQVGHPVVREFYADYD